MFESFTQRAKKVLNIAKREAIRLNHDQIDTEHILLGIVTEAEGMAVVALQNLGIDMESVKIETEDMIVYGGITLSLGERPFSPNAKKVLELAANEARNFGHNYIGTEHILLGLIKEKNGIASKVMENLGATYEKAEKEIKALLGASDILSGDKKVKEKPSILEEFSRDLTQLAKENKLDPVIGRDNEIERVIQILSRRTKNNPILIGEPGVGKTAIAEGLADRIVHAQVPEILQEKRMIILDLASVVAGTKYRGQFEERLKAIMKEVKESHGKIIIFIDEIHTIIGAGAAEGAIDASNMIKPALARGEFQCIGATTLNEYRKYVEKDGALERRFQPVMILPTNIEQTIKIIQGLKTRYEEHHNIIISDEAIVAAVKLSDRYVQDRFLPDKAIDLIDEAGSKARLGINKRPFDLNKMEKQLAEITKKKEETVKNQDFEKAAVYRDKEREIKSNLAILKDKSVPEKKQSLPLITAEDIAQVVSKWTGIPLKKLEEKETHRILRMEEELHKSFVGQDEAVKSICRAIRRSKAKLKDPRRPIGSFIFLGPTGVGKTHIARCLADFLFGDETALITFDMSEYQERFSISRLIGSPPGYVGYDEGGLLTEKIRRKPYSVILFDEIEKAHPDIFNVFLQILEDGRLTDNLGHVVDFRNTVIIMTSNDGARQIEKNTYLGFKNSISPENYENMKEKVTEELKKTFRPEFLNRVDDIVVFRSLTNDELKKIIDIFIIDLEKRIGCKKIILSPDAKEFLITHRDNPSYGARSLRRIIQKNIEDPMTEDILLNKIKEKSYIKVEMENDKLVFFCDDISLELAAINTNEKYIDK